ncbi:hypothetical protein BDC45DRAFT_283922 [Circinella umbellata]|nr:hypothetical protein BDC45DRAFT_283922 [Circinella umbellata]
MDICENTQTASLQLIIQDTSDKSKGWYIKTLSMLLSDAERANKCNVLIDALDDIEFLGIDKTEGLFDENFALIAWKYLHTEPVLVSDKIASMYQMDLPDFLRAYLKYILPHAVASTPTDTNNNLLDQLAQYFETSPRDMCDKNAHYLLEYYLMSKDNEFTKRGYEQLQLVFESNNVILELLAANRTKITSSLAMRLADPDGEQAQAALVQVIKWMDLSDITTLADILSHYFLAILARVSTFITEKREKQRTLTHPHALQALDKVFRLIGKDVQAHIQQTMAIFQALGELPLMQEEAYKLWKRFIDALPQDKLTTFIGPIVRGILGIFIRCNDMVKKEIGDLLEESLLGCDLTMDRLLELPSIPPFPELKNASIFIEKKRDEISIEQSIYAICQRARNDDALNTLTLVEEMHRILLKNGPLHPVVIRHHSMLYTVLLYLSRKTGDLQSIRDVAAECLGILGATDPSRLRVEMIDDHVVVLHNFTNIAENRELVCNLITKHLIPAFQAANKEDTQLYLQYAMQKLLKYAGFNRNTVIGNEDIEIQGRWKQLPLTVQKTLLPLLESSFSLNMTLQKTKYPIYPNADGYDTWIKRWYYLLTKTVSSTVVDQLFAACTPLVQLDFFALALDLLPSIILHVVLSGTQEARDNIINEMLCVLNMDGSSRTHTEKFQRDSLRVVVLITEHCRKWMRKTQRLEGFSQSQITIVRDFLVQIPNDKMAIASFRSKAYPQALMHLEQHIKATATNRELSHFTSETLDSLRQIYAHIDDPDGVVAVFSLFQRTLNMGEEILQYEHMGEWESASILYREALDKQDEENLDTSLLSGYFNCLRSSGNNDFMNMEANRLIKKFPKLISRLNAYRAEASWKLEDWDTLETLTNQPMERSFEACLATSIAHFRQGKNLAAFVAIENAKNELVDHLLSTSRDSYQQSYDHILGLQMLQEVKQSRFIWEDAKDEKSFQPVKDLQEQWEKQVALTSPNYPVQKKLLELRQTLLFKMIPKGISLLATVDDGSLWLTTAKAARKHGDMSTALEAILKAEALGTPFVYVERAKWYWKNNEKVKAIQCLQDQPNPNAKALLLYAKYTEMLGNVERTHLLKLYRDVQKADPEWEKAMYYVGQFYDKNLAADKPVQRMTGRQMKIASCVVTSYIRALALGSKYIYYTMPRFLTLWMEFGDAANNFADIKDTQTRNEAYELIQHINKTIRQCLDRIHPHHFAIVLPQLVSRLSHSNQEVGNLLIKIIGRVFAAYPRSTIWALLPPLESLNQKMNSRTKHIMSTHQTDPVLATIIRDAQSFVRVFKLLAKQKNTFDKSLIFRTDKIPGISSLSNLQIYVPSQRALIPELPEVSSTNNSTNEPYSSSSTDFPLIQSIGSTYEVMRSLQQPKKISLYGSDGKKYTFLVKQNDDLRKDARMMEFNHMISSFLKRDAKARERDLYIRTYGIIPLGENWGLIEWINNLSPLKAIVAQEWAMINIEMKKVTAFARITLENVKTADEKEKIFINEILPKCPAVFSRWFMETFPEPSQWFASRSRYIRTLAVMSIVGYILGLGDRHAENILFDQTTGDCVHVDVNMLFERGLALSVPEIVPFRLTKNLIDAMGVLGVEGMFRKTCEVTLDIMRRNKIQLLSVFQTLAHDPITEWQRKAYAEQAKNTVEELAQNQVRKIGMKIDSGKSIQEEVTGLISQASSNRNLAQMFSGWAAFI